MKIAAPLIGIVALGALAWLVLSSTDDAGPDRMVPPGTPKASTGPAKASPARPKSLPVLKPYAPEPEAPPTGPTTRETVARFGLLGRDQRWLASEAQADDAVTLVDGAPEVWRVNDAQVNWRVDAQGRILGAEVLFAESAMSASVTALSRYFVGDRDVIPVHLEATSLEEAEAGAQGSFESRVGATLYYRATYRTDSKEIFGPAQFEIQATPFK